jgi:hypothetical protein
MTLRHIVYGLLTGRPALVAIVGSRLYDSGALGTPTGKDVPKKPFIVLNYGNDQGGPAEDARVEDRTVDVYAYGEPGDFTVVEKVLQEVKSALHNASGFYTDPDTSLKTWLASARYQGSSSDLYDDVYRANCRYGTYRLVGNTP